MGMLAIIELANNVTAKTMSLYDAVHQHLATGFVKPIHESWALVSVNIIERYKNGDHDLSYKIHAPGKPDDVLVFAESIVDDLHLEPFMGDMEE